MLLEIELRMRRPIARLFNAVVAVGSSSWLAAGLCLAAVGQHQLPLYSAADIIALYEATIATITQQQLFARSWCYGYKYADSGRHKLFEGLFGTKQLGESLTDLELAVQQQHITDPEQGRVWLSSKEHHLTRVVPALMAATAAPGFFKANNSLKLTANDTTSYCSEALNSHAAVLAYNELIAPRQVTAAKPLLFSLGSVKALAQLQPEESDNDAGIHAKLGNNYYR